jgi:hypothetical protein
MTKARVWPVRAMYLLIAAALVISLIIVAAPAHKVSAQDGDVKAEWTRVETPTMDGFVLAPYSTIIDYALASDGEVAYAVVRAYDENPYDDVDDAGAPSEWYEYEYRLLKSDDHAATWTDITDALEDVDADVDDLPVIDELLLVATDWEDEDFVAVALWEAGELRVYLSTDGGATFIDGGQVEDGAYLSYAADLVVSPEVAGKREIAIGGQDDIATAGLFCCTVTGDAPGAWKDATDILSYPGWDDDDLIGSDLVTDLIFSTNWAEDSTILAVTVTDDTFPYPYCDVYLQSGVLGKTGGSWNEDAGFAKAVRVKQNVYIPIWLMNFDARGIAGVTLPLDYSGDDTNTRYAWVWVNYYDGSDSVGEILRVKNSSVLSVNQQIEGEPWLTNVSYLGYIASGKALAGVLAYAQPYALTEQDLIKPCCVGVDVYRNTQITNMDICCLPWEPACKLPTGYVGGIAVSYAGNDPATSKAYAVALQGAFDLDEGAWSVTFDDGDTWNQLSLIDTEIDYLSDVAVSPDCNKTFLVSVNEGIECGQCDSVWLHAVNLPEAPEYSGKWLRTWSGQLVGDDWGFLRLAPEETTGDTVYLVDYWTATVYYNDLETLACWKKRSASSIGITHIVDLAVKDEATIFALDYSGEVAMSDDHGAALSWTDTVDSEVDYGYTIAVKGDWVLVGGEDGDVSYTDDFLADEPEFTLLDVLTPTEGYVTVAFDTYFDANDVIYAAVDGDTTPTTGGIYLWVIGESEDWTDLNAWHGVAYTGIVLDRPNPANPMTSAETGGVLYASFYGWDGECGKGGVARSLAPIIEICCDVGATEWDYLMESDPEDWFYSCGGDFVDFEAWPDALKICGCLTADSNSKLFAIDDGWDYDMVDYEDGAVWMFEDCYAKKAVELTSPADDFIVPTSACECENVPFTIKWDRLCDACCYEIQFAYDAEFTDLFYPSDMFASLVEDGPDHLIWEICPRAPMTPSEHIGSYFVPESTYYWRVRSLMAETDQYIKSWWSEPNSFTVAPTAGAAAINLVSPVPGAQDVGTKNVGFSWTLLASADKFDWVLSKNADLSAPVATKTGLTGTATTHTGTLDYGTTYFWQVHAYKGDALVSVSPVGSFTTAPTGAFCCPIDGLCFETEALLKAHTAEAHPVPGTPFWVWIVIAIGAVLVIVVIVLIFRTRRV